MVVDSCLNRHCQLILILICALYQYHLLIDQQDGFHRSHFKQDFLFFSLREVQIAFLTLLVFHIGVNLFLKDNVIYV